MSRTRAKKPAETAPVPQNAEEASAMLAEIGAAQSEETLAGAALTETVNAAKAEAEKANKPRQERIQLLTRGLEIWATANRQLLTHGGKTKTITLAAGALCWRQQPSSIRLTGVEEIIAYLKQHKLARFLRTKHEVDKEALGKEPKVAETIPGVKLGGGEEAFAVEPVTISLSPSVPLAPAVAA